jgi:hypothetical protein
MSVRKRFPSVESLVWGMSKGYRGKSRKWARRRSKDAIRVIENWTFWGDDVCPVFKRWLRNATITKASN